MGRKGRTYPFDCFRFCIGNSGMCKKTAKKIYYQAKVWWHVSVGQNISLDFLEKILSLDHDLKLKKIPKSVEVWDLGVLKDELKTSYVRAI